MDEVVFDHPLLKGFRHDWPSVIDTEFLFDQRAMLVCRGRSDEIHHAIWEYDVFSQPVPENRISQLGKSRQHFFGNLTVALNIVAGHQGDRRESADAPA